MRVPLAKMTAAAATGPASGLMPASSTPATCATPVAPQGGLVTQHRAQPLPLRAVGASPARDRGEDRLRAGARVGRQRRLERGGQGAAAVHVARPQNPPATAGAPGACAARSWRQRRERGARGCGVRPERRQLEILAVLVPRLGGLVARLLARCATTKCASAKRGSATSARWASSRASSTLFAASAASARLVRSRAGSTRRPRGPAAARRFCALDVEHGSGDDQRDEAGAADDQDRALAARRPGRVGRSWHRSGLGQPAGNRLLAVLQPVQRRVGEAHLLLAASPRASRRRPRRWRRRRLGLGGGHDARIAGAGCPFAAGRLHRGCGGRRPSPAGAASGGGQATAGVHVRRRRMPRAGCVGAGSALASLLGCASWSLALPSTSWRGRKRD